MVLTWEALLQAIAAAGALGTAAFGLVDVSKIVRGGLPSVGFRHIEACLRQVDETLSSALPGQRWPEILKAFWIGGAAKEEQKATVRSLVRLGLSSNDAVVRELAALAKVEQKRLREIALKLESGDGLTERDINVIGRLDATLDAIVDAAFERADQEYRNAARALAAVVAVLLAVAAASFMFPFWKDAALLQSWWLVAALGIVAVPLAPIAKDLSSSLSAAMRVASSIKGGG